MSLLHRKGRRRIDWTTFSLCLALVIIGWMMIYSVDVHEEGAGGFFTTSAGKQAIWIGISGVVFAAISLIDWKFWRTLAYPIYAFSLLLLVAVLVFGVNIKGATSWFAFGGFSIQPSELAKFGTCLAMAGFLSNFKTDLDSLRHQMIAFGLFLAPMFLILLQPDAGSALVFLSFLIVLFREGLTPSYYLLGIFLAAVFIFGLVFSPLTVTLALVLLSIIAFAYGYNGRPQVYRVGSLVFSSIAAYLAYQGYAEQALMAAGAAMVVFSVLFYQKKKSFRLVGLLYSVVAVGAIISYGSKYAFENVLKPHQQERINVWLRPDLCDPRGSLYNVLQSKLAIGSGGIAGKGWQNGTMTKLNYVPEQSTDFIFCTIGEEQGFIGSFGIIALFFLLLYRITTLAERQRTNFSRQYAYAVAGVIFIHFFINISMTMGLLPIIGIPLPFLSKGGSSLLGFTIMIAVLLKLDRNRYMV